MLNNINFSVLPPASECQESKEMLELALEIIVSEMRSTEHYSKGYLTLDDNIIQWMQVVWSKCWVIEVLT